MWWRQWEPNRESALSVRYILHIDFIQWSDYLPILRSIACMHNGCAICQMTHLQAHQLRLSTVLLLPKQHQKLLTFSSFCLKQYFQSKFHVWKSFSMNLVHNFNPFEQFDTILCAWPKNYGHIDCADVYIGFLLWSFIQHANLPFFTRCLVAIAKEKKQRNKLNTFSIRFSYVKQHGTTKT